MRGYYRFSRFCIPFNPPNTQKTSVNQWPFQEPMDWRYLPFTRPKFWACLQEYPPKNGLTWYSTSDLGSWNSHWVNVVDSTKVNSSTSLRLRLSFIQIKYKPVFWRGKTCIVTPGAFAVEVRMERILSVYMEVVQKKCQKHIHHGSVKTETKNPYVEVTWGSKH